MTIVINGFDQLDGVIADIAEDFTNADYKPALETYSGQLQAEQQTFFDRKGGLGNINEISADSLLFGTEIVSAKTHHEGPGWHDD